MPDANRIDVDQHVAPPVWAGTLPTFPATVRFGRFLLDPRRRELVANGVLVPLGGRAFDVLIALIDARGGLVTKDDLLSRVWPSMIVEENALQFQISTLRKALGPDRDLIKTISGRGYCFTAHIAPQADPGAAWSAQRRDSPGSTNPPAPPSDPIDFADRLRIAALGLLRAPGTGWPTVATVFEVAEAGPAVSEGIATALASNRQLFLVSIGIGMQR